MGTSRRRFLGLTAAAVGSAAVGLPVAAAASCRSTGTLYLGTYTSSAGGGTGIGLATYDGSTGAITSTGALTGVQDPSFLVMASSGRFLYAVNEVAKFENKPSGALSSFSIDRPTDRATESGSGRFDSRQNAAQLCDRSGRRVSAGGESEF